MKKRNKKYFMPCSDFKYVMGQAVTLKIGVLILQSNYMGLPASTSK